MSARRQLHRFLQDEEGTTLVELAIVVALFLLLVFMLLDFGRMSYNWVMAEKATQMAARVAAVRPAVCTGVPQTNAKVTDSQVRFGTVCRDPSSPCVAPAPVSCSGVVGNATSDAIWARISPLLSGTDSQTGQPVSQANLRFTYTFDPDMNFLGGPYVPVVTVELQNLSFRYVHPLLGLARVAGADTGTAANTPASLPFPSMSVSLPGEDLALGTNG